MANDADEYRLMIWEGEAVAKMRNGGGRVSDAVGRGEVYGLAWVKGG